MAQASQQATPQARFDALRSLHDGSEASLQAIDKAISAQIFYVDAIECASGDYSFGSSEVGDVDIPYLYPTPEQPLQEIKEEQARYAQEIKLEERDDDDEYDGVLVAVKWDGGDTVTILCPDTQGELCTQTLADVCGW